MIAPDSTAAAAVRTLTITPGGQAQFRFPYDPTLAEELRAAVGRCSWNGNPAARAFTLKVGPANIRAIVGFAKAHGFVGIARAEAIQARLFERVKERMVASRSPHEAEFRAASTLGGTLRPFQLAGVKYAVQDAGGRCLIADEMGLGKTVEALATLETMDAFPAIIVCPASLLYNWERECAAWVPHRRLRVESGELSEGCRGAADILILSYNQLPKHLAALRALNPQGVVFDEGHLLKTATALRTRAAKKLRERVRVRLVLTGTPVLNRTSELLAPLSIIGRLDDLGGFEHFAKRYCGAVEKEVWQRGTTVKKKVLELGESTHVAELAGRLRAICMVRRRKADVLPELPPKQLTLLPVDLTDRARLEYDTAARDVLAWIAQRAGRDPVFRASIAGLDADAQIVAVLKHAQAAADRAGQAEELVRIESLKQIAARGKLEAAKEWIGNVLATGEKLLVFAWHTETIAALARMFPEAGVITGETPVKDRQRIVDGFQGKRATQPPQPLLLLNLQAGGVGLTLTAARR